MFIQQAFTYFPRLHAYGLLKEGHLPVEFPSVVSQTVLFGGMRNSNYDSFLLFESLKYAWGNDR